MVNSTPDPARGVGTAALLAEADWLRRLARRLVADAWRADDLAQDVMARALERPPVHGAHLRAWLAVVMRNLVRQERRGAARRTVREKSAAPREAASSAYEAAAGLALQRQLIEAVQGLEEPERSAVWARFYLGEPPRAIAAREGVPVKTIDTRIARGIARLRARLDREHGGAGRGREAWLSGLVPLVGRESLVSSIAGVLIVSTQFKLGIAAVAGLLAASIWWTASDRRPSQPKPAVPAASNASDLVHARGGEALVAAEPGKGRLAPQAAPIQSASEPAVETTVETVAVDVPLAGRVIDLQGAGVAGAQIVAVDRDAPVPLAYTPAIRGTTEPDGEFAIPFPEGGVRVEARLPGWTTVLAASPWAFGSRTEAVVVMAQAIDLAGIVVGPDGEPVPDAELRLEVDARVRGSVGAILDDALDLPWRVHSGPGGFFELRGAPGVQGKLVGTAPGYAEGELALPEHSSFDLVLELAPPRRPLSVLAGMVLDAEGLPVESAIVAFGDRSTETDAAGRFQLDLERATAAQELVRGADGTWRPAQDLKRLVAVKRGHLPGELTLPPLDELAQADPPPEFVLHLGGAPLSIFGRVLEMDGTPVRGARVWIADTTPFTARPIALAGGEIALPVSIEGVLSGVELGLPVTSGGDGEFELAGLLPRPYTVCACDGATLRLRALEGVEPGGKIELELRAGELRRVAGRVLSQGGEPVPDVVVAPWVFGPDGESPFNGDVTVSDAEGRFAFERLTESEVHLALHGAAIFFGAGQVIPAGAAIDDLELRVIARCHLQVELGAGTPSAEAFEVLDAQDVRLDLLYSHGVVSENLERAPITERRSEVVAAPEGARTLVLYRGEVEVGRVAIDLVPGELTVVRP